jgi:hypothetical protein
MPNPEFTIIGPELPNSDDDWCSIREAAKRLGVTPNAVRGRIERGTLRTRPLGNTGNKEVYCPRPAPGQGDIQHDGHGDRSPDRVTVTVEDLSAIKAVREHLDTVREQLHKAEVEKAELRQAVDRLSQAVGQGAQELSRVRAELDREKGRRQDADRRVSEVETAKRETERRLTELQDRISGLSWWKKLLIGKQS